MPTDVSNNELENKQSINFLTTLLLFLWRDQEVCVQQEKSHILLAHAKSSIWTTNHTAWLSNQYPAQF